MLFQKYKNIRDMQRTIKGLHSNVYYSQAFLYDKHNSSTV